MNLKIGILSFHDLTYPNMLFDDNLFARKYKQIDHDQTAHMSSLIWDYFVFPCFSLCKLLGYRREKVTGKFLRTKLL